MNTLALFIGYTVLIVGGVCLFSVLIYALVDKTCRNMNAANLFYQWLRSRNKQEKKQR